jgi:hypothetical protein
MAGIVYKLMIKDCYWYGATKRTLEDAMVSHRKGYIDPMRFRNRLYKKVSESGGWDKVKAEVVHECLAGENPRDPLKEFMKGTLTDVKCLNHNGRRR